MTARLARRRAKAVVALRLADLDHEGDYITAGAFEELYARSHESEAALRAALNATLFLASTEDAPRIEALHVRQAVPAAEPVRLKTSETAWGPATRLVGWLGACCAAFALILLAGRWLPLFEVQAPAPVVAVGTAPAKVMPKQAAARAAAPLPDVAVRTLPLPPEADDHVAVANTSLEPSLLPEAPPLQVTLVFPAYDRLERSEIGRIATFLQRSGASEVRLERIDASRRAGRPIARNRVFYFFRQDLGLARHVAALLDTAGANDATRTPWSPHLVLAPPGVASHPPGSVEAYIP